MLTSLDFIILSRFSSNSSPVCFQHAGFISVAGFLRRRHHSLSTFSVSVSLLISTFTTSRFRCCHGFPFGAVMFHIQFQFWFWFHSYSFDFVF